MATSNLDPPATAHPNRATSLTALQCELRTLFANRPTNRALVEALQHICTRLDAMYAVVHTRLGIHLLSEEWCQPGREIDSTAREQVNQVLWESVSTEEGRCIRVTKGDDSHLVVSVVMYDLGAEPSGGAALMLAECDRSRVLQVMAQLEGVLGYLALLIDVGPSTDKKLAERREIRPHAAAEHPVRLAYSMLTDLETRYGFDLTAVGFVDGDRVEVAAISGVDDVRAANPGVATVRAAMEECLDRREVIVYSGRDDTEQDDCRLHAAWSRSAQGNPVASLPLVCTDEVVAVVSMSQGAGSPLSRDQVLVIAEELSGYAALVPLTRAANRSVAAHAMDSLRRAARQIAGRGRRRNLAATLAALLLGTWLLFGTLHYTFTVPCIVQATNRRTISCPRSGVLAELFVHPGDRVREGQVVAAIDANDDFLHRSEISAEIESLSALIDQAVSQREAGQVRVYEAKKRSLQAQLVIVDAGIAQAQIRAPQDGIILTGDLRERLGSRIELGTPLFEVARYDRASVVLRIPEKLVLAAHACTEAAFAPASRPDRSYALEKLTIAPASTIVDEQNVFLAEATVPIDLGTLPPGMEGTAHVDAGQRSAWWVLTHRVTDWLHLNFWL